MKPSTPAELVWEEPGGERGLDLGDALAQVRAAPGRWARVLVRASKKSADRAAERIREGEVVGHTGGPLTDVEVTVAIHKPDAKKNYYGIYLRGIPAEDHPPAPRNPSARPKTAATDGKLPYVCEHDDCGADFSTPAGLSHHTQRQHAA